MGTQTIESLVIASAVLIVGTFILFVIDVTIQRIRAKRDYEAGLESAKSKGFRIEKRKNGKFKIVSDEEYNFLI